MVDLSLFLGCDFVGGLGLMLDAAVKRGLQRRAWMLRRGAGDRCSSIKSDGDVVCLLDMLQLCVPQGDRRLDFDSWLLTYSNGTNHRRLGASNLLRRILVLVSKEVDRWKTNVNRIVVVAVERQFVCQISTWALKRDGKHNTLMPTVSEESKYN